MSGKLTKAEFESWIELLRSGKHEQARDVLKDPSKDNCFCCLGVLSYEVLNNSFYPTSLNKMSNKAEEFCIAWNDLIYLTFPQIADKLEENRSTFCNEE